MHGILDSLPVQTNLQRVDARGHILGQQVTWLGPQPLNEGGYLLLTQTWEGSKTGERFESRVKYNKEEEESYSLGTVSQPDRTNSRPPKRELLE